MGYYKSGTEDSWATEKDRRRFWACYLMNCHTSDPMSLGTSASKIKDFTLPWREEDFDMGLLQSPTTTLASGQSNGDIFGELIKALTLWYVYHAMIFAR